MKFLVVHNLWVDTRLSFFVEFQGLREYREDHHWRLDALEIGWTCEVATALCCLHGLPAEGLAVSTGNCPYQGPPVQIGVPQKGLMMTSDEEQIGFDLFWGAKSASTWSLAGFCEKTSQILERVKLKLCRHFSWSCLKWTTNPIHCFNRLWLTPSNMCNMYYIP